MKRLPLGAYYAYFPGKRLPDIAQATPGDPCQSGKFA